MSFETRKPDFSVSIAGSDGKWHSVGAGWLNESGSISVRLNPYTQLPSGAKFTLYPQDYKPRAEQKVQPKEAQKPKTSPTVDYDDMPF